jgi:hypothetical protein
MQGATLAHSPQCASSPRASRALPGRGPWGKPGAAAGLAAVNASQACLLGAGPAARLPACGRLPGAVVVLRGAAGARGAPRLNLRAPRPAGTTHLAGRRQVGAAVGAAAVLQHLRARDHNTLGFRNRNNRRKSQIFGPKWRSSLAGRWGSGLGGSRPPNHPHIYSEPSRSQAARLSAAKRAPAGGLWSRGGVLPNCSGTQSLHGVLIRQCVSLTVSDGASRRFPRRRARARLSGAPGSGRHGCHTAAGAAAGTDAGSRRRGMVRIVGRR